MTGRLARTTTETTLRPLHQASALPEPRIEFSDVGYGQGMF